MTENGVIMKIRQTVRRMTYGISRKLLLAETVGLGLLFLTAYLLVIQYVKVDRYDTLTQQYEYINDRLMMAFEQTYEEIEQLTSEYILNDYVQKSLTNQKLSYSDVEMLKKTLTYYNDSFLDYYMVLDNKGNVYSHKNVVIDTETFKNSYIYQSLGDEYSQTKILWTTDVVFGSYEMSFFAVRYIHGLNSVHEPGIVILKLNDNFLNEVLRSIDNNQLFYFILNEKDQMCFGQMADGEIYDSENNKHRSFFWNDILEQYYYEGKRDLSKGILTVRENEETQFKIMVYAPADYIHSAIRQVQVILGLMFIVVYLMGVGGILGFTRRLTQPISYVSNEMRHFDEHQMNKRIQLHSNTELDQIGDAYNNMVDRVGQLMEDVHNKEKALRETELQSLMYQIRPHFLYNTLDTIYMLARISGEETIMHMIQALSRFLRINLSNGNEEISVQKEVEHASAYLEIQKIRNENLFEYVTDVDPAIEHVPVAKMVLQPITENCIKYGFRNIYEGGLIKIRAFSEDDYVCFSVENNGEPIDDSALAQLNALETMADSEIDQLIQGRQGGFGISNVVKRLKLRYRGNIRFYYIKKESGTECIVKIKPRERRMADENK